MSASKLSPDQAFSPGADLWVIEDNSNDHWWNEIDFRSGFLLSSCLYHHKKPVANQITTLLTETALKSYSFQEDENLLLLGSAQHFHNRWILVWKNQPDSAVKKISQMANELKIKSIRIFSPDLKLNQLISARLSASFDQITYVERP
jgi:hypothetical protein